MKKEVHLLLKKISVIWLPVRNLNRAIEFYRDLLGLKLKFIAGDNWAEFETEPVPIALRVIEFGNKQAPIRDICENFCGGVITFCVEGNLEKIVEALEEKGVNFISPIKKLTNTLKIVTLEDCEGNIIQIMEESNK